MTCAEAKDDRSLIVRYPKTLTHGSYEVDALSWKDAGSEVFVVFAHALEPRSRRQLLLRFVPS
jgi:hypothetical protein